MNTVGMAVAVALSLNGMTEEGILSSSSLSVAGRDCLRDTEARQLRKSES